MNEPRRTALLLLSGGDPAGELCDAALERVREPGHALRVLYVIDRAGCDRLASHLADSGVLGPDAGRNVVSALAESQEQEASEVRARVRAAAEAFPAEVEVEVARGDFLDEGARAAERLDAALILLSPRRRGLFARMVLGGRRRDLEHLRERTGRPVEALPDPYGC